MVRTKCPFKRYTQEIGLLKSSINAFDGSGTYNRDDKFARIEKLYNEFAEFIEESNWLDFLNYYVTCQDPHLLKNTWNMQIFQTVFDKLPQENQNLYVIHYKRDVSDENTLKYYVLTALKHKIYLLKKAGEWSEEGKKNRTSTVKKVKKYAGKLTSTTGQNFDTIWDLL